MLLPTTIRLCGGTSIVLFSFSPQQPHHLLQATQQPQLLNHLGMEPILHAPQQIQAHPAPPTGATSEIRVTREYSTSAYNTLVVSQPIAFSVVLVLYVTGHKMSQTDSDNRQIIYIKLM